MRILQQTATSRLVPRLRKKGNVDDDDDEVLERTDKNRSNTRATNLLFLTFSAKDSIHCSATQSGLTILSWYRKSLY